MDVIPFEVKEGIISVVLLQNGDKQIKIPVKASYEDDLSILGKVDWNKIREEIGQFKPKFIKHIIGLIEKNDRGKSLLSALYRDKETEFSVNRILSILNISAKSKSQLVYLLRVLKYAYLIKPISHGKKFTYQLTNFGMEICDKLFRDDEPLDVNNRNLEDAIR